MFITGQRIWDLKREKSEQFCHIEKFYINNCFFFTKEKNFQKIYSHCRTQEGHKKKKENNMNFKERRQE